MLKLGKVYRVILIIGIFELGFLLYTIGIFDKKIS